MPEKQENKGWQEALRRIEEARHSKAVNLTLSSLGLTSLPDSIGQLSYLRSLNLNFNQLASLPESLAKLTALETLYVGANQLTAVPESLCQLIGLKALYFDNNQLTSIPDSLAQLVNLRDLLLCINKFTVVPKLVSQLTNLQTLDLSRNNFTAVPVWLGQLADLLSLDLSGNKLTDVPESLGQLVGLMNLHLSDNRLTAVPEFIAQLPRLRVLDLSANELTALPKSLAGLTNLKELYLHKNLGLDIPSEILGPTWEEVHDNNKKPKPPKEILDYFFSKLVGARPLNEAKLILVGQGGVGKTSLVKKLSGQKFKKGEKTTEGIKISDWECPLNRKGKVTVHIWDFGGQEMMHATHQFFLTARSLYLLVLNRRPGGIDREADYWFRLVRQFGGKDTPVIVVLNKQKTEPFNVNQGGWLEKYAGNIKGFVETDCEDAKSIVRLKKKIQEELQAMQNLKESFPTQWFAIKNELSQMKDQYVTYERYRELCAKLGEKDAGKQASLAGFLHDLGIALNYKDDPRLRFAYVLKPEWVTEGIYALLHAFVKTKGLFTHSEAEKVLVPKGYKAEAVDFIMGLMEQFEVSFPLGDSQRRSMIPQLFEDQQPDEASQFDAAKCLNFGYKYEIVPEGLLPRFIVRTHHISEEKGRWKSGVILHDPDSGCRALVRADSTAGQVSIHVDGPEQGRRDLLAIIRYNFRVIHSDYEFKPTELVYPPGVPERPQILDDLETFARSDSAAKIPIKLPDKTVITPTAASLIEPVNISAEPLRLFLSYSHRDKEHVEELRKALKPAERNGLIQSWYDGEITAGENGNR